MMYGLKMPQTFACAGIQSQNTVTIQAHAWSVGTIIIISRRAQREISYAAFLIYRYFAPGVYCTNVFPGIFRPGIVTVLARMWDGMECPFTFTGDHIVSTQMARARK